METSLPAPDPSSALEILGKPGDGVSDATPTSERSELQVFEAELRSKLDWPAHELNAWIVSHPFVKDCARRRAFKVFFWDVDRAKEVAMDALSRLWESLHSRKGPLGWKDRGSGYWAVVVMRQVAESIEAVQRGRTIIRGMERSPCPPDESFGACEPELTEEEKCEIQQEREDLLRWVGRAYRELGPEESDPIRYVILEKLPGRQTRELLQVECPKTVKRRVQKALASLRQKVRMGGY